MCGGMRVDCAECGVLGEVNWWCVADVVVPERYHVAIVR